MSHLKLSLQFAFILTLGIAILFFSKQHEITEMETSLAYSHEYPDEPLMKRVDFELDAPETLNVTEDVDSLYTLYLSKRSLTELTEEMLQPYKNAETLDLSDNQLSELPSFLTKMPYLKVLILDNNQFTRLPSFLRHCQKLKKIYVNNNPLTKIETNLWKMNRLEVLQLENTAFQSLPKFPDRKNLNILITVRDYKNYKKETLAFQIARKYKWTYFEFF